MILPISNDFVNPAMLSDIILPGSAAYVINHILQKDYV